MAVEVLTSYRNALRKLNLSQHNKRQTGKKMIHFQSALGPNGMQVFSVCIAKKPVWVWSLNLRQTGVSLSLWSFEGLSHAPVLWSIVSSFRLSDGLPVFWQLSTKFTERINANITFTKMIWVMPHWAKSRQAFAPLLGLCGFAACSSLSLGCREVQCSWGLVQQGWKKKQQEDISTIWKPKANVLGFLEEK